MARLPGPRSVSRRGFLAAVLRLAAVAAAWRLPRIAWARSRTGAEPALDDPLARAPRSASRPWAPFPSFADTGRYGVGTYRAGPADLLAAAVARGAALIDTSPDYRHGETEREIGRVLEDAGAPVFVMTQIPVSAWESGNRALAFHRALRMSLGRLRRHRVEALLVRNAEPWQLLDPGFRAFAREVIDDGLVGRVGASGHGPDILKVLEAGVDDELLTVFLVGAHLARFERMPEILDAAHGKGKLLVAMKSREAALWGRLPGWEREEERRRNSPWDDRWDPGFTRRGLVSALRETGAVNAVLSLRRPEDLEIIAAG